MNFGWGENGWGEVIIKDWKFGDNYIEMKNFWINEIGISRGATLVCCQLNTIRNWINHFMDWKKNTTAKCIYWILYSVHLTTYESCTLQPSSLLIQ